MFAEQLSGFLSKRGNHYSWVIAAVTFLTMRTMSAALGLPGAILQPPSKEFGWSNEPGAATAAYGAGLTRTLLLTYLPALYAAGAACVVAAVNVMMTRKPGIAGAATLAATQVPA